MFSLIPIIMFMAFALFFVGALFDIDWIMKMTKADHRYGRDTARIFWGVGGFVGMIIATVILLQ
jgi:hypothetical protein